MFQLGVGKRHILGLPHLIWRDFPVANTPFRIQGLPLRHLLHALEVKAFCVKRLRIFLKKLIVVLIVLFVSSNQFFQVYLVGQGTLVGVC